MKQMIKWIENYWYHYKGHTIIGLFVALVLVIGVTQCARKSDADYLIMLGMNKFVPTSVSEVVANYFEEFGEDVNGDGEVLVEIMDVSTYSGQDEGAYKAASQKMQAEAFRSDVMIYIVDETFYNRINDHIAKFETCDYLPDKDGTALNVKDSFLAEVINTKYGSEFINSDLYVTKRLITTDDAAYVANADRAETLIQNMLAYEAEMK